MLVETTLDRFLDSSLRTGVIIMNLETVTIRRRLARPGHLGYMDVKMNPAVPHDDSSP